MTCRYEVTAATILGPLAERIVNFSRTKAQTNEANAKINEEDSLDFLAGEII